MELRLKVGARGRGGEKRTREEEEKARRTKGSAGANPNGFVSQLAQRIRETPSCQVDPGALKV